MLQLQSVFVPYKPNVRWRIDPDIIEHHILLLVTEGKVVYHFEDSSSEVRNRELLYIPAGTYRWAESCPPDYHRMYSVHFDIVHRESVPLPLLDQNPYVKVEAGNFDYVKQRLSLLSEMWHSRMPYYQLYGQNILQEMLILMNREFDYSQISPKKLETVRELQNFIMHRYREKINLTVLSEHARRTPNYISAIFKETIGLSPIEYLNQTRVAAARDLLLHTSMTIAEVAEQVGYTDPYYFTRVYKRITGVSPRSK